MKLYQKLLRSLLIELILVYFFFLFQIKYHKNSIVFPNESPFYKPFLSLCIMSSKTVFSLFAIQVEADLYTTLSKEIGLQFFKKNLF